MLYHTTHTHTHILYASGTFCECIASTKRKRAIVGKVLHRMTHQRLAGAFDCYSGAVAIVLEQRAKVAKTIARWRSPWLKKAFEVWGVYVDMSIEERAEDAREMVRNRLQEAAEHQQCMAATEAERRIETCKKVVKRMLHQQLAISWGTFL